MTSTGRRGSRASAAAGRGRLRWAGDATSFSTGTDGPAAFWFNPRKTKDIFAKFFGSFIPFGGMSGGMGGMGGQGMRSGGIRFSPSMFFGEDAFTQTFCGGGEGYPGMFGGSGGRAVKATPIKRKLPCSLEELYKGSTKKMKISREISDASGLSRHPAAFNSHGVNHSNSHGMEGRMSSTMAAGPAQKTSSQLVPLPNGIPN